MGRVFVFTATSTECVLKAAALLAHARFARPACQMFWRCSHEAPWELQLVDKALDIEPSGAFFAKLLEGLPSREDLRVVIEERCLAPAPPSIGCTSLVHLREVPWDHVREQPVFPEPVEMFPAVVRLPKKRTEKDAIRHLTGSGDPLLAGVGDMAHDEALRKWQKRIGGGPPAQGRHPPQARPRQAGDSADDLPLIPEGGLGGDDIDDGVRVMAAWETAFYQQHGVNIEPASAESDGRVHAEGDAGDAPDRARHPGPAARVVSEAASGSAAGPEYIAREVASGSAGGAVYVVEQLPPLPPPRSPVLAPTAQPEPVPPTPASPVPELEPQVPAPAPAPPEPEPLVGPALPRIARGERLHCRFGPFLINELHPSGSFRGLSAVCGRHPPEPGCKVQCRTNLNFDDTGAGLSVASALLQLKRWLALGCSIPPAIGSRRSHIFDFRARGVGSLSDGQRAAALAAGLTAADLDGL